MPAIDQRRDVDIDDIAFHQSAVAGNAVADHIVDRGAAAVLIAAITHRRGDAAASDTHAADDVVQLAGGDAGYDIRHQRVQYLRRQPPGLAHSGKAALVVKLDRGGAGGRAFRRHRHIIGHEPVIDANFPHDEG
jgi:hypothetical protein